MFEVNSIGGKGMIKKAIIWMFQGLSDFWHEFTSMEVSYGYYLVFKNNVLESHDTNRVKSIIKEIGTFSPYGMSGFKGCSPFKEEIVRSMIHSQLDIQQDELEITRSDNWLYFIR